MRTYAYSSIGIDHAFAGGVCEDAIKWSSPRDGKVVVAVADGMGSARLASAGSETAAKSAERMMRRAAIEPDGSMAASVVSSASVRVAMAVAANAVLSRAVAAGNDPSDYNTTLMVVSYDAASGVLDYGYVGDGGIVVAYADQSVELLEAPQKGETSSSTYDLTSYPMWRFGRRDSVTSFVVATDGVMDALLSRDRSGIDEALVELLLAKPHDDALLDRFFGATFDDPNRSPVAGVVDDRSVFMCWGDDVGFDV